MTRPRLLFSAPFDFLGSLAPHDERFDICFEEVWERDDLPALADIAYWIPNPGQHFVIDREVLERFPNLKAIATPSTGSNHVNIDDCRASGIEVYSLLDDRASLEAISASAEFTFLHVLNALRRIDVGYEAVSSGNWRKDEDELRGHELQGRRVGLVGFGRIGRRLARYFDAFGCPVTAFDPQVATVQGAARAETLDTLFAASDILVVCCALTDETRGMIGRELLGLLPERALVVNTSRGEVLREDEVVNLLEGERPDLVFCADVVEGEVTGGHLDGPLVAAHQRGRMLVTPHIAGATVESQQKAAVAALERLDRHEAEARGLGAREVKR